MSFVLSHQVILLLMTNIQLHWKTQLFLSHAYKYITTRSLLQACTQNMCVIHPKWFVSKNKYLMN